MANKSPAGSESITAKIADLRQQMRSFAKQRAEGLIDEDLQRELVNDLKQQIEDLEKQQSERSASTDAGAVKHAESDMVDEMIAEDESGEVVEEDTHEHPEVTVSEASDEPEHADAEAVAEITEDEDAKDTESVVDNAEDDTTEDAKTETAEKKDDSTKHAQTEMVDEMIAEDESGEVAEEDTHEHPEVTVNESSDEPEHADKHAMTEIIEEEVDALHRDEEESSIRLGDFADEVVVSSAMIKEPDYLNSIHDPNVVDIRDITKTYHMGEFDLEVLKGITLQIRQGEFVSIMGPSGSGKSTLMNILGALDQPSSGEYFLDNVDVSKLGEKELAEVRNSKIGFVFQSFNLLKRTTALRQVELPLIYGSHKDRARKAREALEAVGLGQRLDHTPAELSGGQQQRVAIARALVTEPSLILADEPTGNLDSRSGTEVMQLFQTLNRKNDITTIFVTHDPWIARHTDRVIMLRDGRVIADQRVKEPLIAGESERPSEAEELQAIFESTYYGGDEEEYT